MRYFILCLLSLTLFAADPPPAKSLPPGVDPIVNEYKDAVSKAKVAYEQACAKAQEKALDKLDAKNKEIIKKGDVDGAIAVKAVIERIQTGKVREEAEKVVETDLLGRVKIIIISAKYGIEDHWVDATQFIKSKVKDGYLKLFVNDDVHSSLGDPAGGQLKSFVIVYTLNGVEKITRSFAKGAMIELGSAP